MLFRHCSKCAISTRNPHVYENSFSGEYDARSLQHDSTSERGSTSQVKFKSYRHSFVQNSFENNCHNFYNQDRGPVSVGFDSLTGVTSKEKHHLHSKHIRIVLRISCRRSSSRFVGRSNQHHVIGEKLRHDAHTRRTHRSPNASKLQKQNTGIY